MVAIKGGRGGILGWFGPSEAGGFRSTTWLAVCKPRRRSMQPLQAWALIQWVSLCFIFGLQKKKKKILPCFFEILRWEVKGVCSYLKAKWIHYLASSKGGIFRMRPTLHLIRLLVFQFHTSRLTSPSCFSWLMSCLEHEVDEKCALFKMNTL